MDLLTLFPFIMTGIAILGSALLIYETRGREKTETAQEVVDRLKAQGVGGPNDTGHTDYNCKYCGSHFDHEDDAADEDLMDPALFAIGVAAAESIAQAGPPDEAPWQGDGGQFSGAGASGSYDLDPSSSPDSSDSSDSDSSSSSDSGSSDSGSSDSGSDS